MPLIARSLLLVVVPPLDPSDLPGPQHLGRRHQRHGRRLHPLHRPLSTRAGALLGSLCVARPSLAPRRTTTPSTCTDSWHLARRRPPPDLPHLVARLRPRLPRHGPLALARRPHRDPDPPGVRLVARLEHRRWHDRRPVPEGRARCCHGPLLRASPALPSLWARGEDELTRLPSRAQLGILVGPATAPAIAGILTEYVRPEGTGWRAMQWLLMALGFSAFALVALFLPETAHVKGVDVVRQERLQRRADDAGVEVEALERDEEKRRAGMGWARKKWDELVWVWINPLGPVKLLAHPTILAISLNSSFTLMSTYSASSLPPARRAPPSCAALTPSSSARSHPRPAQPDARAALQHHQLGAPGLLLPRAGRRQRRRVEVHGAVRRLYAAPVAAPARRALLPRGPPAGDPDWRRRHPPALGPRARLGPRQRLGQGRPRVRRRASLRRRRRAHGASALPLFPLVRLVRSSAFTSRVESLR